MPFLGGAAVIGLSLTTGMLLSGGEGKETTVMIPIPPPVVKVTTPTAPVAPPAPINVTVEAPKPPEVPTPAPSLRVLTPTIDIECIGAGLTADAPSPACSWDNGFPAISGDGTQIAGLGVTAGYTGSAEMMGLTLTLQDVATLKTRSIVIVEEMLGAEKLADPKMRAKFERRVAEAQRLLDDGKFRTLRSLGTKSVMYGDDGETTSETSKTEVYAEWSGATMRLVDPTTSTVLWRHKFSAPDPQRGKKKPDDECAGWSLASVTAYWDPETKIVSAGLNYHRGGCMCGEDGVSQVFRL